MGEYGLTLFEHRVLEILAGPKKGEITAGYRKLYNKELYNVLASPCIV
jgi:hypothetical protein